MGEEPEQNLWMLWWVRRWDLGWFINAFDKVDHQSSDTWKSKKDLPFLYQSCVEYVPIDAGNRTTQWTWDCFTLMPVKKLLNNNKNLFLTDAIWSRHMPGTPNWKGTSSSKPPLLGSISIFRGVFEVVKYQDVPKTAKKKNGEPCNSSKVFLKLPTCKAWRVQLHFLGVLWGDVRVYGNDQVEILVGWDTINKKKSIGKICCKSKASNISTQFGEGTLSFVVKSSASTTCACGFSVSKPEGTYFSQSIVTIKTNNQNHHDQNAPTKDDPVLRTWSALAAAPVYYSLGIRREGRLVPMMFNYSLEGPMFHDWRNTYLQHAYENTISKYLGHREDIWFPAGEEE